MGGDRMITPELPPPVEFLPNLSPVLPPGTRVSLPRSGRSGAVLAPPWAMPGHTLVLMDGGDRQWILTSILEEGKE